MAASVATKWKPSLQHVRATEFSKKANVVKPSSQGATSLGQACESERIISKFELLAARVASMQNQSQQSQGRSGLHTVSGTAVSPSLKPSPPPGLEPPCDASPLVSEDIAAKKRDASDVAPLPQSEPTLYKVLLQNLPEQMLKECMLRVMLEQAGLKDIMAVTFSNRKTLITLSSFDSGCQCIAHFSGRQWGNSGKPVTAAFVRSKVETKTLSSDAPSFVPGAQCFVRGYGGA